MITFPAKSSSRLVFDAFDQLKTAHDRSKIHLLAAALASCAAIEFSGEERKELFVRLIRDLTPFHIRQLRDLADDSPVRHFPPEIRWANRVTKKDPSGESLMILQQLAGEGLVEEELETHRHPSVPHGVSSQREAVSYLEDLLETLKRPPMRCFRLSQFGRDFINFVKLMSDGQELSDNHGEKSSSAAANPGS